MQLAIRIASLGGAGILTEEDLKALNGATVRIYNLMRDGGWHRATQIIAASGQREGLRRIRELRRWCDVERMRLGDSREWAYRLTKV